MTDLIIPQPEDKLCYPYVNFNVKTGICEISGESAMEDYKSFYSNIIN